MQIPFRIAVLAASTSLLVTAHEARAQKSTGTIIMRVTADSAPVSGAEIAAGASSAVTDQTGVATFKLPTGMHTFRLAQAGLRPESLTVFVGVGTTKVAFPVHKPAPAKSAKKNEKNERAATVVQAASPAPTSGPVAARSDARLATDAAEKIEVADRGALDEQLEQSPGNIADLLSRLDGVRVQPQGAGAGGVGIRIRGMPGRYTKVLSDGLPLYGATSQGLEALQTSALGLERVEVTPGVTSALSGPTSLAGIVNVVSAGPTAPSEVVVNGSTLEGSDVGLFQTYTFNPKWAATLVAGRHYQNPSDPDGDGWAEVNGYKRIVARPRVYWSRTPTSSWFMTGGWTSENRRSGTFGSARLPNFRQSSDDADTRRGDAGTIGRIQLDTNTLLTVRASLTREWRTRWFGEERERDRRNEIFGDVSLTRTLGANVVTGGVAIDRDQFTSLDTRRQNYRYTTPALYAEHTWTPERWIGVTSAARLDMQSQFGDFVSPRVSVVVRPSDAWFMRVSRANGVYAPTPLTDETATYGLSQLQVTAREAEHAIGWTVDVGRAKGAFELGASGYRTVVSHPFVFRMAPNSATAVRLENSDEEARTMGGDAYLRYNGRPIRLAASYSYVDATRPEIGEIIGVDFQADTTMRRTVPYNPRHSGRLEATYERENDRIIGVEARFVGKQVLADSSFGVSEPFVTIDARVEKHVRRAILFVRAKNLVGVHQLQYGPILRSDPGPEGAWADNAWGPLEGRVINAGVRVTY